VDKDLKKKNIKENPLLSLIANIFFPVMILKNGESWLQNYNQYFHLEIQAFTFLIALLFPFTYFFFDLYNRKNINFISILGFVNVLLTGGIGIFGEKYGLTRTSFILKEGLMPLIIGFFLIILSKFKKRTFDKMILNKALFDVEKIKEDQNSENLNKIDTFTTEAGYYFIAGFFISSIIQFILAYLIVTDNPGDPGFNEQVSTMTWVSYIAVLGPTIIIVGKGYLNLINGIERLTGLKKEDFLKA
jgi:hypothetical protein